MKNTLNAKIAYFAFIGVAAIALVLSIAVAQASASTSNSTIKLSSLTDSQLCTTLGNKLNGADVLNGDICDVVLSRNSPNIIGDNSIVLNKFTLMNSVLEFKRMSNSSNSVYLMGDFALLENELNPVLDKIVGYGWTVTGIHNHMIMESPRLMMMHFEATDDVDTLVAQINSALTGTTVNHGSATTTPSVPNTGIEATTPAGQSPLGGTTTNTATTTATTTPAGQSLRLEPLAGSPLGGASNATSTGSVTLEIVRHLCPSSIQSLSDLNNKVASTTCPVVTGNEAIASTTIATTTSSVFENLFLITARDQSTGVTQFYSRIPDAVQGSNCTATTTATSTATSTASNTATSTPNTCTNGSTLIWNNVPRSDVTITQGFSSPQFGFATTSPSDVLVSQGSGVVNLDTRNDVNGKVTVDIYDLK